MKKHTRMNDDYSVSVVMPTFNRKEIVSKNISKLLDEQKYNTELYEVIVVDDGSTDGTFNYLQEKFSDEISQGRLKVLRQKNHGLSKARNLGISNAKGKYICRFDDDDTPLPNRISDSIEYFKKNPKKRLVHAKSYWVDDKERFLDNGKNFISGINRSKERLARDYDLENKTEDLMIEYSSDGYSVKRNVVNGATTMAHRSLYDDMERLYGHVYDPHITTGEDKDLWVRIAKLSKEKRSSEFGFLDKIVANYTFTRDQIIKQLKKKPRMKDLNSYIGTKLNSKQKKRILFAPISHLNDSTKRSMLHRESRRAYRNGESLLIAFRDPESGKYLVRSMDSDAVMKKPDEFFGKRMYEYDSLDSILKEQFQENLDQADYFDGSHFLSEFKHLPKDALHRYVVTEDLDEDDFFGSSGRARKRKKLLDGISQLVLNHPNSSKVRDAIKKKSKENAKKIKSKRQVPKRRQS